jgi:hypothetical protein
MKSVLRSEILPPADYEARREALRAQVLSIKATRRIHVGRHLTFLFENADTVRYQVQEMLRVERKSSEADVAHELATYNELLGGPGQLGCTLMIEIEDALERDLVLRKWLDLPRHVYLLLEDGTRARAAFDERQVGAERISAVQFLKFECGRGRPIGIGLDRPGLECEVALDPAQRAALAADLGA